MPRRSKTAAASAPAKKTRGPKPFTQPKRLTPDKPKEPHKYARRELPPIERASEVEFPLVYRAANKHPRNGEPCREVPLVASPEHMLATVFDDGTRLVTLRRNVHELDVSALGEAGTESDRKFWGTR